jgi:hypothetical protein
MTKDKRKSRRRQMRYSAWLAFKGDKLHGCALHDISETGARIDVEDGKAVPDRFVLLLSANGSARRKCRVVWRQTNQIGVSFEPGLAPIDRTALVPAADADARADTDPSETV